LAAALLAELVLTGNVEVHDGGVYVIRRELPDDPVGRATLAQLLEAPQHRQVQTWLAFLAETAVDAVGHRLTRAGYFRRVEQRRLFGARVVYLPVDANKAAWPEVRLARMLTHAEPMTTPDAVLAGLVAVTGLAGHVLWDARTNDAGMDHLTRVVNRLPGSLFGLLAATEAAVGQMVLAPH
jgi:hypothetical protein